ncbi:MULTISPECIES: FMN-dependent NADH-azoreductase [Dyella]|uniref:FMN-dependent NADH-azoreductase n=1 Tax=Dyella TaxID=231454 RepID=UPI000C85A4BF|nr:MULTISPECIES: FMN-dependent NADH-azoreductase [Dyella]MDR3446625.1 FMN-dependent NADH-azoreductase [Dyella sp.]PMQ02920.1 FMN-dependent NADH-azoreductase 1 [Dyella sp. AD56]ULU23351.1 FMN-dependent NADH-azoreductase [Dyella terrae]
MKLLHLDASALGSHSVSRGLTAAIVAELTHNNPGTEVIYHDLAANPLPHWTPVADASDPAAVLGSQMIEEFLAADVVVMGAPMYNFSIPSQLKAWIDRVAVAGKSFRYTANGPEGLAGGKRLIVVSSRGGVYSQGSAAQPMDFQETYLRAVFGFLGVTDIEFVRAEGVNLGEDNKVESVKSAHASIGTVARKAA